MMLDMDKRALFYKVAKNEDNFELDYLDTTLPNMKITEDVPYRIDDVTHNRPDLISFRFYGNYNLWWIIAEHNKMTDPFKEFVTGKVIRIPTIDAYYQFFNRYSMSRRVRMGNIND